MWRFYSLYISVVTLTACGILLSLSSHAGPRLVFWILWSFSRSLFVMLPLCKVCMLHVWWFAYYLCVWAASCVCWRGVWEGHHCGRIIMEIAPKKIPFLSASVVYPYTILFYSFISVHSLPCEGFVWFLLSCLGFKYLLCAALGYTWHSSWISSSSSSNRIVSFFFFFF